MAAVLACGLDGVLEPRVGGALWGWHRGHHGEIHVTAPTRHRLRGVIVHRSRTLTPADVTVHYGIPVTTPARTLLDLADTLTDRALARAVNEARLARQVSVEELQALIERSPGRATGRLKRLIERRGGPTRSEFEDAFLDFARRHRLPPPLVNERAAGYEVDLLWPAQRLVGELDSRTHHDTLATFETDRERDADLLVAGYRVIRITWRRLKRHPTHEAERLRRLLAR